MASIPQTWKIIAKTMPYLGRSVHCTCRRPSWWRNNTTSINHRSLLFVVVIRLADKSSLNVCRGDSVPTLSAIPAILAAFSRDSWPPRDYCSLWGVGCGGGGRQPPISRNSSDLAKVVYDRWDLNHYATTTSRLLPQQTINNSSTSLGTM